MNKRFPRYPDDADYQTNAPSYYEDLGRKNHLIKILAKRIWDYEKTLHDSLEEIENILNEYINIIDGKIELIDNIIGEGFNDRIEVLLREWVKDGTLNNIINEEIFNTKADVKYVDEKIESINDKLKIKSYNKYGFLNLDFFEGFNHNINFNLFRDTDGLFKHDFKIDRNGYVKRYIKSNGSMENDGKTEETSWSRLNEALKKIENDNSLSKVEIVVMDILPRASSYIDINNTISKDIIITSSKPIAPVEKVSFDYYEGKVYKGITNLSVSTIIDSNVKSVKNISRNLEKVDSLNECLLNDFSYTKLGGELYVNNGGLSLNGIMVIVQDSLWQFTMSEVNQTIILDKIELIPGSPSAPLYFQSNTETKGNVILNNCIINNFGKGTSANGVASDGIKNMYLFNVYVFNAVRDGFNYHNTREKNGKGFVFEYYCYAENTGTSSNKEDNNNISSAHEGIHILRIGTKGYKSNGPLISDVNGCYSVNIDVEVFNTGIFNMNARQNSAFYFDDADANYINNPDGKAWLLNCSGGSESEYSINCDDNFKKINKIFIDNFKGNNIPEDLILTSFSMK